MSTDDPQGQPRQSQNPPPHDDVEIREGAWHVIQQGAQVFAELGGGAAGIATAKHLLFGGADPGTDSSPTPQPPPPPVESDS